MTAIRTEEVVKLYNRGRPDEMRALDGVSVEIPAGRVTVLCGPSGSGKTTLLSLIGCMSRPTSGRVLVEGKNVAGLPERFLTQRRRRLFGFIFQQFHLVRDLSVLENVVLPLYPLEVPLREMRRRGDAVLEQVNLSPKRDARVKNLSGGEQQRVAVARALINDPHILIADEPTAHLDRALSDALLTTLERLREDGRTVVIATHDPLVYDHPCVDRVVQLRDGRLVVEAPG